MKIIDFGMIGFSAAVAAVGCLARPVVPQDPNTSNLYVAQIKQTAVDKIDLLFMIDNSQSMLDKQKILGEAVGGFMARLVTPICVDDKGAPTGVSSSEQGECTKGSPEFPPIRDIHIGVVTSSLGAHGGQECVPDSNAEKPRALNDQGQLLPKVRPDPDHPVHTWNDSGFLVWDPDAARGNARHKPAGESVPAILQGEFQNMVLAVGQNGCGYEASLESWYRFLIEPDPYESIPSAEKEGVIKPHFVPPEQNPILQQRKQFLRPDSMVVIVMLSDENDCSIVDAGQAWLVGQDSIGDKAFHMPKATSACEQNPNDKCCTACSTTFVEQGCLNPKDDPACKNADGSGFPLSWSSDDNNNLRCFDQKRRFGVDFLYPTSRYVSGLYDSVVADAHGNSVQNPLYAGSSPREPSLVFIAGIVGVPWQDIATKESWPDGAPLTYLKWQELTAQDRWSWILGETKDPNKPPGVPKDKLMFETPVDRSQLFGPEPHPGIGAEGALAPSSVSGRPNKINGHESNISNNKDLQYACIFPLPERIESCTKGGCDCPSGDTKSALCEGESSVQTHAKAYPGVRQLRVLKDYGEKGDHNSIVASICPKTLQSQKDASYGYNPAVAAIVERLKDQLRGRCLPRRLEAETQPTSPDLGKVPCVVIEAMPPTPGQACTCQGKPGRADANDESKAAAIDYLKNAGTCGEQSQPQIKCENFCFCEIEQLKGEQLQRCQTEPATPGNIYGYCYIDPSRAPNADVAAKQEKVVDKCPATQRRMLRFAGDNVPAKGATAIIECLGSPVSG